MDFECGLCGGVVASLVMDDGVCGGVGVVDERPIHQGG